MEEKNIPALQKGAERVRGREYPAPEAPPLELDVGKAGSADRGGRAGPIACPLRQRKPRAAVFAAGRGGGGVYPVSEGQHARCSCARRRQPVRGVFWPGARRAAPMPLASMWTPRLPCRSTRGKTEPSFRAGLRSCARGLPAEAPRRRRCSPPLSGGATHRRAKTTAFARPRARAALYRLIRRGRVRGGLQPLFAQLGADRTGKTLAGLAALTQLGLIEISEAGRAKKICAHTRGGQRIFSAPDPEGAGGITTLANYDL